MFHIKSTTPAIITIDKDFLLENFTHKIDIDKQNMIIKYYPLDKYIDGKITLPYVKNINLTKLKAFLHFLQESFFVWLCHTSWLIKRTLSTAQ